MGKLLSICIPTYNRSNELSELIEALLTIKRADFEIVITDNQSTDNTREVVSSYEDNRVRYCYNEKALPALMNTIHSIYNGEGKYVLYCNDRDILYPDGVVEIMSILELEDYSFIHSNCRTESCAKKLRIYGKGYESLLNQHYNRHPSGMIFNRRLIEEHVKEKQFEDYLQYIYTYDFLMLNLIKYEKSAFYCPGYWGTRPASYLSSHKAGTGPNLHFLPQNKEKVFCGIVEYVLDEKNFKLQGKEKNRLIDKLYTEFAMLFCNYKLCMSDVHEAAHYGLDRKHISTVEMVKIYRGFFDRSIKLIEQNLGQKKSINDLINKRRFYFICVIKHCVKINVLNIIKCAKNLKTKGESGEKL